MLYMKRNKGFLILMAASLLLSSCAEKPEGKLPTPQVEISTAPEVDDSVTSFLALWEAREYGQMYDLLSSASRSGKSSEDFIAFYQETAFNATLLSIETQLLSSMKNPGSATAKYKTIFNTSLFGSFEREIDMSLILENNDWKVDWNPGLILPELAGGNRLQLDKTYAERGEIFARDGQLIVDQTTAYALAIIPNQIEDGKEGILLNYLADLTGRTSESIQASYEDIRRTNWYVPVGEVSADEIEDKWEAIIGLGGVRLAEFQSRY